MEQYQVSYALCYNDFILNIDIMAFEKKKKEYQKKKPYFFCLWERKFHFLISQIAALVSSKGYCYAGFGTLSNKK